MPTNPELFRRVRETLLRHVYERQVVSGKWGVDFFWARKDIARAVSRPGHSISAALSSTPPTVRTRRFDWGFEATFERVIEHLAEEELLEVRMTSALAGGRGNSVRIRDYKLTEEGIRLAESLYGPPLPGEASQEPDETPGSSDDPDDPDDDVPPGPGPTGDTDPDADPPDEWDDSDETAEIDMDLALRANEATGRIQQDDDRDVHVQPKEKTSDVDVTQMPGRKPKVDPRDPSTSPSGRRSAIRRDTPSDRHSAVN